ncbi:MAG: amino acid permease [Eubacteriales bacterium]|nr:amino acid permease [Eubacteriales bacterium]
MSEVRIKEVQPLRNMGFWMIWAVGVGSVVGDGIFLLLGEGIEVGGPSAVWGFFLSGLIQMCIMISLGEVAVGMPNAGAMSVWVERYMGKSWGLLSGMTFSVGWVVLGGSISIALGRFTCYWFPSVDLEIGTIVFAALFFTVFTIMNIVGTAIAAKGQLIFVLILVAIMVLFGILGIKEIDVANYTPWMPNGFAGFAATIPMGTFAYMGAVCIATSGSECRDPRDLGKALVWASITFIVMYTVDMLVVVGIIPWEQVSLDVSPFTQAAEVAFGYAGGFVLNIAAWLAAATCLIMGTLYTPSRIFYQMSKDGYLPKFFGELNEKTRTPIKGLICIWAVGMLFILLGYFDATGVYVVLCNQATIAWILSWGLATIAGILYRREMGSDRIRNEVGWKQPLYPLFPIISIGGCLYVLYLCFYDWVQFVGVAIWVVIYLLWYNGSIKKKIAKGLIHETVIEKVEIQKKHK